MSNPQTYHCLRALCCIGFLSYKMGANRSVLVRGWGEGVSKKNAQNLKLAT